MNLDDAIAAVYTEACVCFRNAAVNHDLTAQMKYAHLAELLEVMYPRQIEAVRHAIADKRGGEG